MQKLRTWDFWRDIIICFTAFSWLGHFMEMAIIGVGCLFSGRTTNFGIFDNWFEPYYVYGFAVIAIIIIITILPKKIARNLPAQFVINTAVCMIFEIIAGLFILWQYDRRFWDYSEKFLNFHGFICLENSLFFGVAATGFSYFLYPILRRNLEKIIPPRIRNIAAIILPIVAVGVTLFDVLWYNVK